MEKVISFESLPDHYTADACVVWCFDDRFYKLLKAFGKQEGFKNIDLVKVAGGAKALGAAQTTGEALAERDFLVNQIKLSMRLHDAKRVILMTHRDCGGYGGSKAFADAVAEKATHETQLSAARDFVKNELKDDSVKVDAYFADFDSLYLL